MKAKRFLGVALVVAIVCSLFVASAVTASAAEIIEDGLIGWYKLDGDFTNSADSSGETDAVRMGNANTGTAFDEEFWYDEEVSWTDLGVDGTAWYQDGYEGIQTLNPGNNDFTVSFWLAVESGTGYTPFMWYGSQLQYDEGDFLQGGENWIGIWDLGVGAVGWSLYGPSVSSNCGSDNRISYNPESTLFSADEEALDAGFDLGWTMVTISCVLDEESNTYTISYYLNGEPVVDYTTSETSVSGFPNPYSGDVETYGDYIYFRVNYWDGGSSCFLDDILIYNVALTADEVAANYAAYTVPSVADLLESVYTNEDSTDDTTDAATEADDTDDADTTDEVTEADGTDDANTTAGDETDADTGDSSSDSGCGSALGAAAVIMAVTAVFGCAVVKKK
ncbi:MAG: LamG domain-containing protein [Firmicutes bacterium]|nr:LamG domain-containing protein [Bacillota bacterium]